MVKDKQTVMGFKTYEKEATQNKHVNAETKQTKNQGFWVMTSRTLEQVFVLMSSTCVSRLDLAYANPYPENLINTKTELKLNKIEKYKSSNLTCLKT